MIGSVYIVVKLKPGNVLRCFSVLSLKLHLDAHTCITTVLESMVESP
jgi:hypothetical protein